MRSILKVNENPAARSKILMEGPFLQKDEKIEKLEKCKKMSLAGHGSPEYRKQSIWRGCPAATDAPDTIFRPKIIKHVVSRLSESSEKTNARRRILQWSG